MNLEISWEPWCSSSLDKSQFAPFEGPQLSVRVLLGSHKIPGCFYLIYLFKQAFTVGLQCARTMPSTADNTAHKTYNVVGKTRFQNNLTSRCKCTSVLSTTKERYMAICNSATENTEAGPAWGDAGWRGLYETKKKAEENLVLHAFGGPYIKDLTQRNKVGNA